MNTSDARRWEMLQAPHIDAKLCKVHILCPFCNWSQRLLAEKLPAKLLGLLHFHTLAPAYMSSVITRLCTRYFLI